MSYNYALKTLLTNKVLVFNIHFHLLLFDLCSVLFIYLYLIFHFLLEILLQKHKIRCVFTTLNMCLIEKYMNRL